MQSDLAAEGVAVRKQPFEAKFLGGPVYRLDFDSFRTPNLESALQRTLANLGEVRLVCARVPDEQEGVKAALVHNGFALVERLVTLERVLEPLAQPPNTRLGTAADARACADIARAAFRYDRFHADPRLPDAAAEELKAAWAHNNTSGRADVTFLSLDEAGAIAGFNHCLLRGDHAIIDLIAVSPASARQGHGRRLIMAAISHYVGRVGRMIVGTQATNLPSLKLYRSCGFTESAVEATYHLVGGVQ